MGINEVGMVNGAMSRKVEITLNSAVSLVQMLQPILFIPCYGIGCPIRWFPPFKWAESKGQLYHNVKRLCVRWRLELLNLKISTNES